MPISFLRLESADRNSAFYRGSFVSGGACKTNGTPFPPHFYPLLFSFSRPFSFTLHQLSTRLLTCLLTYLFTFHSLARKPDVYYRACLAISVLSLYRPPEHKGFHSCEISVRRYSSSLLSSRLWRIARRVVNVVIVPGGNDSIRCVYRDRICR